MATTKPKAKTSKSPKGKGADMMPGGKHMMPGMPPKGMGMDMMAGKGGSKASPKKKTTKATVKPKGKR